MPAAKKESTKQKKGSVSVSDKVDLDPVTPIPFENGQAFSFVQNFRYSPFLNPSDTFAQLLLEAKLLSVTHSACIETKKVYCAGRGIYDKNKKDFSPEQKALLKRMNARGESQLQLLRKAFGSFFQFGNVVIEVVRMTVMGKKKLYVYVHNFLEWRLSWPDADGNITKAIHSKLFLRSGIVSSELLKGATEIPLYNPDYPNSKKNWKKDPNGTERTIIWIKNDMDGYPTYGMPSAVASLIYQLLEYKTARYNLDNLENNQVIGALLALKGNVSDAECQRIARNIIKTHTGDGKRGRLAVIASEEGGIEGSTLHNFDTHKEGSFTESDEKVMQKIIMANEWSALLAGLSSGSSLGKGNSYLRTDYNIKKATVIDPAQEFLVANMWEVIWSIAGNWMGGDWENELGIQDIDPLSVFADIDPINAIKVNEMRKELGLEEDKTPKGNLFLGEIGKNLSKPSTTEETTENVPAK